MNVYIYIAFQTMEPEISTLGGKIMKPERAYGNSRQEAVVAK